MASSFFSMITDAVGLSKGDADATLRSTAVDPVRELADHVQKGNLCQTCWMLWQGKTAICEACGAPRPAHGWPQMPFTLGGALQFTKQLGRGGQGAVFLAIDLKGDEDGSGRKPVRSVKVLQRTGEQTGAEEAKDIFEHETSASALLGRSPFFIKVFGYELGEIPYLVMDYVAWPTLEHHLAGSTLTSEQVTALGIAILQAVEVMHFYRVVHRDLKPSNLFVNERRNGTYRAKIADFGCWTHAVDDGGFVPESLRIKSTKVFGTTGYMSPEQMTGGDIGVRSDIHAVASILWESCTGTLPFPVAGNTPVERIRDRISKVEHAPDRPQGMSKPLYEVLARALSLHPEDRYASTREMTQDLRRCAAIAKRGGQSADTPGSELSAPRLRRRQQPSFGLEGSPSMALSRGFEADFDTNLNDRYEIHKLIGAGSVAGVYEAHHLRLDLMVAVKVMNDVLDDNLDEELVRRQLEAEARAGAMLEHPCAVRIFDHDIDWDSGRPFIAMEKLGGDTLSSRLKAQGGALDEATTLGIITPILGALTEAHGKGILHRNLKPKRIFFKDIPGYGETPILTGFGPHRDVADEVLPKGMIFGTPKYMAPEQFKRGVELGPATDIYALGTLLCELLTGSILFKQPSVKAMLRAKLQEDPPLLPLEGPRGPISPQLQAIVALTLQRDLSARPTAETLAGWLKSLIWGQPQAVPLQEIRNHCKVSS